MAEIKYAVYPGSVTTYGGVDKTFTAAELAAAYGVDGESYLTVNSNTDIPQGESYFEYIHLKPRKDDIYVDIKEVAHDDGQEVTYDEDFDGDRMYIQETRHPYREQL